MLRQTLGRFAQRSSSRICPAPARRFYVAPPATFGTDGEKHIFHKLNAGLSPTKLAVTDSSGGCGSMYVVEIEAECFRGLNRVKQTKMVNALLKDELKEMHGMRVLCSVPPKEEA